MGAGGPDHDAGPTPLAMNWQRSAWMVAQGALQLLDLSLTLAHVARPNLQPPPIVNTYGPYEVLLPNTTSVLLDGNGTSCAFPPCALTVSSSSPRGCGSRSHSRARAQWRRRHARPATLPFVSTCAATQTLKACWAASSPARRIPLSACACAVGREVPGRPERPEDWQHHRFARFWRRR